MKVSQRIEQARRAKGLTQAQLAVLVGVSTGTVCNWEKGVHGPKVGRLKAVAAALAIKVSELVA